MGYGSVWLERLIWDQEVVGSNPVTPIVGKQALKAGKTIKAPYVERLWGEHSAGSDTRDKSIKSTQSTGDARD